VLKKVLLSLRHCKYNHTKLEGTVIVKGRNANNTISLYAVSLAVLLTLVGCAPTQRCEPRTQIRLRDTSKAELMKAAQDVLGRMHFSIEKADSNVGYIRTKPLPGAQFFEFWRSDNVGEFNSLEANLHSIRRTVVLDVAEKDNRSVISCDVQVQRLSIPEQHVTSSSRAYAMFSESTAAMQRLRLHREQRSRMAWLDLGKDPELATAVLERIEKQITGPSQSRAPQTRNRSRVMRDER
jgi:hypothetical protein